MISNFKLPIWLNLCLIFPIVVLDVWLFSRLCQFLQPIPSIIITASLIAFLLEFPIISLERQGLRRSLAISLVLLIALVIFSIISLILGPLVLEQSIEFAKRLPDWLNKAEQQLQVLSEQGILQNLPFNLSGLADQLTDQISRTFNSFTSRLINFTFETINGTVNFLVTLVLSILLVINGPALWEGLLSWLPSPWSDRVQMALRPSFQGYFSGQAIIASILGVALSIAFTLLKIPFGLLFGIGIGIASVIPFGGTITITLVSGLLAFQNVWLGAKVLTVSLILGQINENVVAPRLIGGITGLNPAAVFMSLLVGARAGGFLGLILAVPTASFVKRIADTFKYPEKYSEQYPARYSGTDEISPSGASASLEASDVLGN
ncbi:MAG: AI-2E family transporter [Oscillatoriales cyanobacterium RM2_1_1]|nr:AI-2E family transporter [Oscillatoriales cyanobacterium RM2_1_1]